MGYQHRLRTWRLLLLKAVLTGCTRVCSRQTLFFAGCRDQENDVAVAFTSNLAVKKCIFICYSAFSSVYLLLMCLNHSISTL